MRRTQARLYTTVNSGEIISTFDKKIELPQQCLEMDESSKIFYF